MSQAPTGLLLTLAAGALLVSAGLFVIVLRRDFRGLLAGVLMTTGGVNAGLLAAGRWAAGTHAGDVLGLLVLLGAACELVLAGAWYLGAGGAGGGDGSPAAPPDDPAGGGPR